MKRICCVLCLLCLMAGAAMARCEDKAPLPSGVLSLCEQIYPDYWVGAYYGRAGDTSGQCALVLTNGQENILCIAEKSESDEAYAFTVETSSALFQGDRLPSLFIDTGGDVLFCSYADPRYRLHAVKGEDGIWRLGSISIFRGLEEWQAALREGYLTYTYYRTDENDNILDARNVAPIPVSAAFEERMANLSSFDIEALAQQPGVVTDELLREMAGVLLDAGDSLLDFSAHREELILLAEAADGARRIVIATWNDAEKRYSTAETSTLPQGARLDTFHASEGEIILILDNQNGLYGFLRSGEAGGAYSLNWVMADDDFAAGVNYVCDGFPSVGSNNEYTYGTHPWSDLLKVDLMSLPESQDEALSQLDSRDYAVVNNPNPADRLHLRAAPDRNAASYGKFYNRMPVRVLDVRGDWAHVRAGEGEGLEGWMMTEFLAFGDDMRSVQCAFPQLCVKDEHRDVMIYSAPDERSQPMALAWDAVHFIVGVHGDEWFLVMTEDGRVGYVRQACFWPGNG
ncbi:SH3 domain-containing protein [Beduinella massiliensis]|uniref:SH3 domain-containing protein n=1 Tax=Beduinella massiliensis TaxID=1852363 RepID=UPI0031F8DDD7